MSRDEVLSKLSAKIAEIRQRFFVESLFIFGSIARDEAGDKSDIDVLVYFDRPATFDLFMDLKFYLEDLLNMNVDLVTGQAMRPQVRKAIEGELINVA